MLNIILSGAPGSGKGTQSDLLVKKYGLQHLSTGDVLRAEIATGSALGHQIDALISKGNLVPDDMMYGVIENYIASLPKDCKGTIFDGYPRTVAQAAALTHLLKKYNMDAIMIDLLVDEQLLIQRLIDRGKMSGRADDNLNTIRHRIAVYHNQTEPIAHYYLHKGNYFAVNGNQTMADVFLQIMRIVDRESKK
ncbi:MAG: adenylate kinase [Bacteroidales bacterium]|nr:adenylate kinase [Bacteroidales bacterium]MDD5990672.1 adenylate kinase [Paludibacteraceae bacterium]MDD6747940.1 adenylate kinase [Paludibacteraceae bacterium]